eukprot:TRINITY_DN2942_c0_g1_i2.p1 TRINITY_DN2942_c0_g1~~TRINITY_DN2942_c0_g1_i2.p1  ORF type:complete len:327 (-),score=43.38 TRINITY_DN2942_c0_g1_i2:78-1058(-)
MYQDGKLYKRKDVKEVLQFLIEEGNVELFLYSNACDVVDLSIPVTFSNLSYFFQSLELNKLQVVNFTSFGQVIKYTFTINTSSFINISFIKSDSHTYIWGLNYSTTYRSYIISSSTTNVFITSGTYELYVQTYSLGENISQPFMLNLYVNSSTNEPTNAPITTPTSNNTDCTDNSTCLTAFEMQTSQTLNCSLGQSLSSIISNLTNISNVCYSLKNSNRILVGVPVTVATTSGIGGGNQDLDKLVSFASNNQTTIENLIKSYFPLVPDIQVQVVVPGISTPTPTMTSSTPTFTSNTLSTFKLTNSERWLLFILVSVNLLLGSFTTR